MGPTFKAASPETWDQGANPHSRFSPSNPAKFGSCSLVLGAHSKIISHHSRCRLSRPRRRGSKVSDVHQHLFLALADAQARCSRPPDSVLDIQEHAPAD